MKFPPGGTKIIDFNLWISINLLLDNRFEKVPFWFPFSGTVISIPGTFSTLYDSIIHSFLYVISRTIQNISFNTPYDLTTRIKSLICKITRFYKKIFVTSSYGTLNGISMIFPCITKNNLYPFSGRNFFVFLNLFFTVM